MSEYFVIALLSVVVAAQAAQIRHLHRIIADFEKEARAALAGWKRASDALDGAHALFRALNGPIAGMTLKEAHDWGVAFEAAGHSETESRDK